MPTYRATPSHPDRAKAMAGVAAVYAVIACAALLMPSDSPLRFSTDEPTVLVDVKELPEPQPPPPPPDDPGNAELEAGAAGKKAEPTPIVAPKPRIDVPATPPVTAAPIAGTGSAATSGAATSGTGPGAGGSGNGRGGGGSGGNGEISTEAKLLGGNSARLPSRLLRTFAAERGYAYLFLTISDAGRATNCDILQTTGDADVDQALCNLMVRQSRWEPARDRQGQPISVKVRYTATWKKN